MLLQKLNLQRFVLALDHRLDQANIVCLQDLLSQVSLFLKLNQVKLSLALHDQIFCKSAKNIA